MPGPAPITAAMCARGTGLVEPRLAPGGGQLAWVAVRGDRAELVVAVLDAAGGLDAAVPPEPAGPPVGAAHTITADPAPMAAPAYGGGVFDWLPDGSGLVYAAREGDLWEIRVAGGPARRLTNHGPRARAAAPAVAPDGHGVAYVVDQRDVAVVARDGRWPVRLSAGADFCVDPAWTADGRVVWQEWDVPAMPWDASRLVAARGDGGGDVECVHAPAGASVQQPRPAPGSGRLACVSDEWGWANVTILTPDGPARRLVADAHEHAGPTWGYGQRTLAWSPDGEQVAFSRNEDGFGRLCVADVRTGAVTTVARGVHGNLTWAGERLAALRSEARTPTQVVVYDTITWARTVVAVGPVAGFEAADLPEPEAFTASAPDGATLHARWYPPAGATGDRPVPTIVWVHGGPTDQWAVTFRPRLAYFAVRGWATLVPDHRGSTGHGRAYAQALRGRWGELDVTDCATLVDAAVAAERADHRRLVAMGGSAGGFTVLNLLAREPDRFAAGVALYPVTDLLDLTERTHRFEGHYCDSLVGPLPEAVDHYRARSPMAVAERITAPLLVLHGADDEVVPAAQADAFVARHRAAGGVVEHHCYDGEGHGWGRPETVVDELERIEHFLERHARRWRAA